MTEFDQDVWPAVPVRVRMSWPENNTVPHLRGLRTDAEVTVVSNCALGIGYVSLPFTAELPTVKQSWAWPYMTGSFMTFKNEILPARLLSAPYEMGLGVTVLIRDNAAIVQLTQQKIDLTSRHVGLGFLWPQEELNKKAAIVLAVERRQFTRPEERQFVKAELKAAAELLWQTGQPRWEPFVWSAIRRFASMLTPDEATSLGIFLAWNGDIETQIVSLIALQIVFHNKPPAGAAFTLADAVFDIAKGSFLAEQPAPGDHAALAQQCIYAIAILGDERLIECISWAVRWGIKHRWFVEQVRDKLEETAKRWSQCEWFGFQREARNRLSESLGLLNESLR